MQQQRRQRSRLLLSPSGSLIINDGPPDSNRAAKPAPAPNSPPIIALPALDDREAIQVALSVVIETVANGMLDPRRAGVLLRGLQIASKNAADIVVSPHAPKIRSYLPTADGLALAPRQMSDNSQPTAKPPQPRMP